MSIIMLTYPHLKSQLITKIVNEYNDIYIHKKNCLFKDVAKSNSIKYVLKFIPTLEEKNKLSRIQRVKERDPTMFLTKARNNLLVANVMHTGI